MNQHLDGSERIANFVPNASGQLTDGGQLFGTGHFALAVLQLLDHAFDPIRQAIHLLVQFAKARLPGEDDVG